MYSCPVTIDFAGTPTHSGFYYSILGPMRRIRGVTNISQSVEDLIMDSIIKLKHPIIVGEFFPLRTSVEG